MDALVRAWSKAVRTALPGPWRIGLVVREVGCALVLGALATLLDYAGRTEYYLAFGPVVALLFLLRRGLPSTVLVLTAAVAGAGAGPLPLLVCAGWSAGARIKRVGVLIGSFTAGFLLIAGTGIVKDAGSVPLKALAGLSLGAYLLLAVLPGLWGRYRAQRRALTDALRERNEQLLRERAMVAHQARLRERHRIAQDMHDSLGHQLALISVHSGALEVDRTLTDRQREAVGVLRLAAVAAMRELRDVVGVLHDESTAVPTAQGPGPGLGCAGRGGVEGIAELVESSRAAGTDVALGQDGERRELTASVGQAAYRIVQEALTNAHKHAPGAPITVALRYEPDALVVEVANPPAPEPVGARVGGGTAVVSGGQGLTGLRERARLVGGMVHAGPTAEAGFRLAALLPYDGSGGAGDGSGAGPAAAGGAVGVEDWIVDGLPPVGGGSGEQRRRSPAIGCAVGGVLVVLTVLGLLVWGAIAFIQAFDESSVKGSLYDSIEVGSAEADVLHRLPSGNGFFTKDYERLGPTPPAGSHCRHFIAAESNGNWGDDSVIRFCFKDGVLVEKQHFPTE
ncbi:histidine kinase [Kitasatospora sp. CM 4170]|uniref:histidine kinase n=1 Tax=Kitasatospora aburaviensis TaxID=67265 RepID=A0ABW1F754_9ACTN|nr:histidine kinase [Kitasatospora sp. CM 4170]WNM49252.1 histidine kinase [Kitasatospora sp. CM 4170]